MQPRTRSILTKRYLEVAYETKSWHSVERNGWTVKFSQYKNSNILLFIFSQRTGQTIIRYFPDEDKAVSFINIVIKLNSDKIYDL
jgi:hypothetical protein